MYQRNDFGFGQAAGAATLSLANALPAIRPGRTRAHGSVAGWLDTIDFVPDLGLEIGSTRWFRGAVTCLALCGAGIALVPKFRPLPASAAPALSHDAWEERRTLSIAPLALGGDSGKRMAAGEAVIALAGTPERPTIDLAATLGQGDGFARVLERAGVSQRDAARVVSLVSQVTPIGTIAPGTQFKLTLGRRENARSARPLESLKFRARFDLAVDVSRSNGALALTPISIAVDNSPVRIQGRVGESLYRSARAAGVPATAVEAYIRAIASKMSISSDVNADARFDIIVEHQRAETGEARYGKLLFAGLDRDGRKTQLLQWTIDGRTEWFEASGVGMRRAGMAQPVYGRLTSGFGMRFHPLLGYTRMHQGVDYGAAYGAPIYAVADGTVSLAGRHGGHGNHIRLEHGGGLATSYSHMSRFAVANGYRVSQGQIIGYVGSTGLSTGPHLHFEVYRNGVVVNPSRVNFSTSSLLSGNELAAFRDRLRALLATPVGNRG